MKEKRKDFSKSIYSEQMKKMGEDNDFCAEYFLDILSEENGPIRIVDNEGNLLANVQVFDGMCGGTGNCWNIEMMIGFLDKDT
jgi:hypothetical protein